MAAWIEATLGDFLTLQRGFDLAERMREDGTVPIVSSSGISGYHSTPKVNAPGVVTGRYGTLGEVFYVVRDFWPLNTTLWVKDFKGNNPRFVSYLLKTLNLALQNAAGAVPGVNRNALHMLPVKTPPVGIQERIASILSAYDDLIENNTRRIKILEDMAQMLYREWFVNFRFPGHENVRMVESELGPIPEGWSVRPLAEIYRTGSGGTPSRKVPSYFGGTIRWVKTQELLDCFIHETDEKITEEGLKNSSAKLYPERTVLMAMYGATIGKLGVLAKEAACNQASCAIMPKTPGFGPEFLYLTLLTRRTDIIALRMGAAQQNISQEVIKAFPVSIPERNVITTFTDKVASIFKLISILQAKNSNLRTTRDLLLPKLISGEVSVAAAAELMEQTA